MDNTEEKQAQGINNAIAAWIQKNRKIIIIGSLIVLAVLIILGLFSLFGNSKNDKATAMLTDFEEAYYEWSSVDEAEKEAKVTDLKTIFSNLESGYSSTYAYQRALFLMGDFYYYNEEWDDSISSFTKTAELFPKSYLAPIALFNAAAAREETGNSSDVLTLYLSIAEKYTESSLAPRALFSAGRISEGEGNEKALTMYNSLIEEYPSSSWTKLARNRIIKLQTGK